MYSCVCVLTRPLPRSVFAIKEYPLKGLLTKLLNKHYYVRSDRCYSPSRVVGKKTNLC
jgi:hypothetical protein